MPVEGLRQRLATHRTNEARQGLKNCKEEARKEAGANDGSASTEFDVDYGAGKPCCDHEDVTAGQAGKENGGLKEEAEKEEPQHLKGDEKRCARGRGAVRHGERVRSRRGVGGWRTEA